MSLYAEQIEFLQAGNSSWALATVDFYAANSTTRVDVYSDREKSSTVANPYTFNSLGRPATPIYADGLIKIVITPVVGTAITFDYQAHGLVDGPWVDVAGYASLNAAITAIGSTVTTLLVNASIPMTANATVPVTLGLKFQKGGIIDCAGFDLTINGDVDAGMFQIFDISDSGGSVAGLKESCPEWFIANTTPGTTDVYAGLAGALASISHGGLIILQATTYRFGTQIVLGKKCRIQGTIGTEDHTSVYGTVLLKGFNGTGIVVDQSSTKLDGIILDGINGNTGDGIHLYANSDQLSNFSAINQGGIGIRIGHATETKNCNHWQLNNVVARNNGSHGILIDQYDAGSGPDANAGLANGIWCSQNAGDGLQVGKAEVNTFVGISNESNTGYGIHFATGAKNNTLVNPHAEVNTAGNGLFDSGSLGNMLVGSVNFTSTDNGTNLFLHGAGASFATHLWSSRPVLVGTNTVRASAAVQSVGIDGILPGLYMYDTDATADYKHWDIFNNGGTLSFRLVSDDGNTTNDVLKIARTGTTEGRVTLKIPSTTYADNAAALAGGLTVGMIYRVTGAGTLNIVY